MKTLFLCLIAVLSGCAQPIRPDQYAAYRTPTVVWTGQEVVECTYVTSSKGEMLDFIGVELTLDGHRGLFEVDTASGKTILRADFVRKLGVKISDQQVRLTGGGSKGWRNLVFLDRLDLGFARIEQTYVVVADLVGERNAGLSSEDQFEGIIGLDLLNALGAEIEVSNHKIYFRKKRPNQPPEPTSGLAPIRGSP